MVDEKTVTLRVPTIPGVSAGKITNREFVFGIGEAHKVSFDKILLALTALHECFAGMNRNFHVFAHINPKISGSRRLHGQVGGVHLINGAVVL